MRTVAGYVILCAVVVFGFPARAEAYLDPTTGSMVLQVVMGGVLAAVAATKVYWHRVRSLLNRNRKPEDERQ